MGASSGTNTVTGTPASRAAHASAWPWLPALAATTPAARSVSLRCAILLTAPRILKAPVLVEQPSQLSVLLDRLLEMGLCPRRRDREHLAGEVPPAPLLEPPAGLE